jgi:hypothetical protein
MTILRKTKVKTNDGLSATEASLAIINTDIGAAFRAPPKKLAPEYSVCPRFDHFLKKVGAACQKHPNLLPEIS